MRKIIVILCTAMLICFFCHGQEKNKENGIRAELDNFGNFAKDEPALFNTILFIQNPTGKHSKTKYTYLFSHEDRVWETLLGISREFLPNVYLGISAGFEFHKVPTFRMGASMLYKTENFMAEFLYEHGNGSENYWYKATLGYEVVPDLILGLRGQKGIGIGTFAQLKIGRFLPYVMYGVEKVPSEDLSVKERHRVDHIAGGLVIEF